MWKWVYTMVSVMNINTKIRLLVLACILIVSCLGIIQLYLIQNTYRLAKEKYIDDIKETADKIAQLAESDSIENHAIGLAKVFAGEMQYQQLSEKVLQERYKKALDSINQPFVKRISPKIDSLMAFYDGKYINQIDSLRIINTLDKTILLVNKETSPILLSGTHIDFSNAIKMGASFSNSESADGKGAERKAHSVYIYYSQHIDISHFNRQIWAKIGTIFTLAVVLLLAVIVMFFLMFKNLLTQKKIAEIQSDFANNITHELKTPLASLQLAIKSLAKTEVIENPEKRTWILDSLQRQGKRLQYLMDTVLESTMGSSMAASPTNLEITEFIQNFFTDFPIPKQKLVLNINPEPIMLHTDSNLLTNILNNLLDNAIKYSPDDSEIQVKTYSQHNYYCIEIQDNGNGISPRHQKHIFDKFYRVSQGDKHNVKGLGLGLYLSKLYIEQLNAQLSFTSKMGEGSKFMVMLPLSSHL